MGVIKIVNRLYTIAAAIVYHNFGGNVPSTFTACVVIGLADGSLSVDVSSAERGVKCRAHGPPRLRRRLRTRVGKKAFATGQAMVYVALCCIIRQRSSGESIRRYIDKVHLRGLRAQWAPEPAQAGFVQVARGFNHCALGNLTLSS